MKKVDGAFQCPVCKCRYRHNWLAWVVGIPIALGVAFGVFLKLHSGAFSAFSGAIVAFIIVSRMGLYRLITGGEEKTTIGEVQAHEPEKKESRWVIIFMVVLLVAIAIFFCSAMRG